MLELLKIKNMAQLAESTHPTYLPLKHWTAVEQDLARVQLSALLKIGRSGCFIKIPKQINDALILSIEQIFHLAIKRQPCSSSTYFIIDTSFTPPKFFCKPIEKIPNSSSLKYFWNEKECYDRITAYLKRLPKRPPFNEAIISSLDQLAILNADLITNKLDSPYYEMTLCIISRIISSFKRIKMIVREEVALFGNYKKFTKLPEILQPRLEVVISYLEKEKHRLLTFPTLSRRELEKAISKRCDIPKLCFPLLKENALRENHHLTTILTQALEVVCTSFQALYAESSPFPKDKA